MERLCSWTADVLTTSWVLPTLQAALTVLGMLFTMWASTISIRYFLPQEAFDLDNDGTVNEKDAKNRRVSYLIGKCENIIIVLFVLAQAETGLGLLFTAKSWVRKKDIENNPEFYLGGTLVNFAVSLLIAYGLQWILEGLKAVAEIG